MKDSIQEICMGPRCRAFYDLAYSTTNLYVTKRDSDNTRFVGVLQWVEAPEGTPVEPTVRLDDQGAAQELMDRLWNIGFRPTEHGSVGQMAAMQNHLNDMRAIVSHQLGAKL